MPLLALVLTLMFSAFGNSASAQDACIPDCANDTWGDLQPYTMYPDPVNFPYCQVTVYFRTRFACNTYYDVYIDRVESANLLSCTSNPSNPLSFGAILAKITEKLLIDNPMGFPPNGPYCDLEQEQPETSSVVSCCKDNWRVMKGSCWKALINTGVGSTKKGGDGSVQSLDKLMPCTVEICCLDRYKVCYEKVNGVWTNKTVQHLSTIPQGPCHPDPYDPINRLCFPVCGNNGR